MQDHLNTQNDLQVSGQPRWGEVAAVALTGVLHLVCKPLGLQGAYIVGAILFWVGFVLLTARSRPTVLAEWGFRSDNLRQAFIVSAVIFFPVMGLMAVLARVRGTLMAPPSLALMLLLYPAWGLVQQFLVQSLLVTNLAKGPLKPYPRAPIIVGGFLFSLVHVGNISLMLATGVLGAIFVWLYLRHRNLWPLGLFHGWLASLFYQWFLLRDPLTEIFGWLLGMP
jgi:hypothetical protein